MTSAKIPVIDFDIYGLNITDTSEVEPHKVKELSASINNALGTIGFCYLKNHGVPETLQQMYRRASKEFFLQSETVKGKYKRLREPGNYLGWVASEEEAPNPNRPGDLKEAFNYSPNGNWGDWPEDLCPTFHETSLQFFETAKDLAKRVLEVVAIGLNLPNDVTKELIDSHKFVGQPGNHTEARTLYYPPIGSDSVIKPDQVRMGEHFDFGSITLLFQDNAGGLEVCDRAGEYIPATPIPGTVILNVGEVMQRWTADRLIATKHRVMIPEDLAHVERQSLVLFLCPDDDAIIRCIDGSNKYKPTAFLQHAVEMMEATYKGKYN